MFDSKKYQREYYARLKRNKLCTKCQKQDAYTLNGWSRCYECNEKRHISLKKDWVEEINNKNPKSTPRQLYVRCWICNSDNPLYSRALCKQCYDKATKSLELGRKKLRDMGYRMEPLIFGRKLNE